MRQRGFAAPEILMAVAIIGIIAPALLMGVTNTIMNSKKVNSQNVLLTQVENAGHWVSRDLRMADSIDFQGPGGFPLTLTIPVDDLPSHNQTVTYSLIDGKLQRQVYDSYQQPLAGTWLADHLDVDHTAIISVDSSTYNITLQAATGGVVVTRSYEARSRLGRRN